MDLQLDGKVALVTASSKGIGAGIARGLAREGAVVIVHGRDQARSAQVADRIRAEGGRAHVVTGDLTDTAQVSAMIDATRSLAGDIDILINNAGCSGDGADWSMTLRG